MPTYEYKCNKCGNVFEVFQSMSAAPIKICPNCNGDVKRLIGPGSGPIFKGSGFYQTDYKNNSTKTSPKKDSSKSGSSSSAKQASSK
ncbi:MAG: zinc ribbon domain-containing protein [Bacteroidetes bacterium]|nr:zinc ribbon domain-containing protein [Bacteroidota bacterium]